MNSIWDLSYDVSIPFLTPMLLERHSFGLQRDTQEETQGEIAQAQGLVSMPFGICSMLVRELGKQL